MENGKKLNEKAKPEIKRTTLVDELLLGAINCKANELPKLSEKMKGLRLSLKKRNAHGAPKELN